MSVNNLIFSLSESCSLDKLDRDIEIAINEKYDNCALDIEMDINSQLNIGALNCPIFSSLRDYLDSIEQNQIFEYWWLAKYFIYE